MTKLLFVTGLSGSGKTTLGELLKNENNFVHFNVDVWAFGGDPIEESALVPNPQMMAKRDPEIQGLFDKMIENGFKKLAGGETPAFDSWTAFFDRLVPVVKVAHTAASKDGKDLVVTFSVYLRAVRDYLRQQFQPEITDTYFVILHPDVNVVAQRKVQHLRNTAEARELTLSAFLRSFNPASDAPELSEEAIAAIFNGQTEASSRGFEGKQDDEPNTLLISSTNMSVGDERDEVISFFRQ
jgi:hypothetical protein